MASRKARDIMPPECSCTDKTAGKRVGQSCGNGSSVCVQAIGERMWDSVCVLSVVKWILRLKYGAGDLRRASSIKCNSTEDFGKKTNIVIR